MVGLELQQQHPHDLFSGRDIPPAVVSGLYDIPAQDNKSLRCCCCNSLPNQDQPFIHSMLAAILPMQC